MNHLLVWLIISPILLAALTHFIKKYLVDIGFLIFLVFSFLSLLISIGLFRNGSQEFLVYKVGNWSAEKGIILVADHVSLFFLVFIQVLFFSSLLFSKGYVKRDHGTFFSLFYLLQAGLIGMVLAGDLFNMYVFLEIVSMVSYALVAYDKNEAGLEAGFKYLLIGSVASLMMIWAIGIIYATTGNLNIALVATHFNELTPLIRGVVFLLLLVGFGIKFALFPFHPWLADAHSSAPSPISAILSGVMIKVQIYCLIRIVLLLFGVNYILHWKWHYILMILGVGSVLVGHLMAIKQVELKRMLAYSSIAHIGYIVIGLSSISTEASIGAFYHMINHGVLKVGLFYFAGILIYHLNIKKIEELAGLFWRNPLLSIYFCIFALGMVGVPPMNGFFSKWLLVMGTVKAGYLLPAVAIAFGGFISLIYYLRIALVIFKPSEESLDRLKIDPFLFFPISLMVVLSFTFAIFGNGFFEIFNDLIVTLQDHSTYLQEVIR